MKSFRSDPGTVSAQMAPTRMKLRVRRRVDAAEGGSSQLEEEERSQDCGSRRSCRRKSSRNTSTTNGSNSSSPPHSSSASASARAALASEEASPDSKCPICLDRFNNMAYLDRCLHRFCFPCIQEWSHNKAECPLCKQPFASILHSVRAEDDFKEYTLRPAPTSSSVAATVAMVAAMASAARSDHQMRLMLRRHRVTDVGEPTSRRWRRERGGRGGGAVGERAGVWEWYLDSPPLPPHPAVSPVTMEDSGEVVGGQRMRGGVDPAERGVIFEGLLGLEGPGAPLVPNDRESRQLMTRLAARTRLQREGGSVRRLRERETVAFRRSLYRSSIRVRGVSSANPNQLQSEITAESFRQNPAQLSRLRPWLRRELTVLYGARGSLVEIMQRIIMARLARHGLEDMPTIEEELRPFLLARTEHFLHELVSFARSPLSLESYDLQAVYELPEGALQLDGTSSSSDSSSVIAISEGEEEGGAKGGSEERLPGGGAPEDVFQTGSCLSLSAWDDETPGPSYSTAEPSCSMASLSFSPSLPEAGEKRGEGEEEEEEECLIVGYKKPIAERTPELVQLSSDSEDEEEKKAEEAPPVSSLPPSTSDAATEEQHAHGLKGKESLGGSWDSVCMLSPPPPDEDGQRERRRRKRRRRGWEQTRDRLRKRGTISNPNRSIYPAMMRQRSQSSSPLHSSSASGSPLPPSLGDSSSWECCSSPASPLTSSLSSHSTTSPLWSSPQPSSSQTAPLLSPCDRKSHCREKPGGKRKYKSRHLDSDKDPSWRPSDSRRRRERRRRKGREKRSAGRESSRRRRDDRSPSVEIIYEDIRTSDSTQRAASKHQRGRQRRSPVVITLDSDSSGGGGGSSSSQPTVDFSGLPHLPLVHSVGVGGAMEPAFGELPVDILETDRQCDAADKSDRDVDAENIRDGGSVPGRYDDGDDDEEEKEAAPIRQASPRTAEQTDSGVSSASAHKQLPPTATSHTRLPAPALDELQRGSRPRPPCSPRPLSADSGSAGAQEPASSRFGLLLDVKPLSGLDSSSPHLENSWDRNSAGSPRVSPAPCAGSAVLCVDPPASGDSHLDVGPVLGPPSDPPPRPVASQYSSVVGPDPSGVSAERLQTGSGVESSAPGFLPVAASCPLSDGVTPSTSAGDCAGSVLVGSRGPSLVYDSDQLLPDVRSHGDHLCGSAPPPGTHATCHQQTEPVDPPHLSHVLSSALRPSPVDERSASSMWTSHT